MRINLLNNYQTVKPRTLKLKLNIRINERVMCANFGDSRSRDREMRHKKHKKTAIIGLKIY